MPGEVRLAVQDGVAELVLDRPSKHNAITPRMAEQLENHARDIERDEAVRAVLIRGEGERAFSAGSDLNALAAYASAWEFRNRIEYASIVRAMRKPVVAALQGWTLGGGAETALGADYRIASETTKLGFPEVQRGWVGGGGASQLLPRIVGHAHATRLLILGDPIPAAEALAIGLVHEVVEQADLLTRARAVARRLASFSPVAVQSVKAALRAAMEAPLAAGLRYENEMNVLCFSAGDHMEGIRAFNEDREAAFTR